MDTMIYNDDLLNKKIADEYKLIDECIETLEALNCKYDSYSNESIRAVTK